MLRVVVAVALATALVGASMPAVQTARVDHAHGRVDIELETLVETAARLQERNDPVPPDVGGARRTVVLHLPGRAWTATTVAYLIVPGPSSEFPPGTVRYRVADGRERTRSTGVPLVGPRGGLQVTGGRHRLVLEYIQQEDGPVVLVRHPELKSDAVARPGHDTSGSLGAAGQRRARGGLQLPAGLRR